MFIALTQVLFAYCIYDKIYAGSAAHILSAVHFTYLVLASVFIAAAGYIINDYFDLNIDQVNKPDKVVVNAIISRRWVIFWHMFLSLAGMCFTMAALPLRGYWHLVLGNLASIFLLWFYSTTLKKRLLIGNVLISLLTAWVILILFLAQHPLHFSSLLQVDQHEIRFFRFTILYAAFAFVISLIREVVKDMEDLEGDRKYGCRTMPIVWGVQASKLFAAVWLAVLITTLSILQFYILPFGWWPSALYCLVLVILPLIWILVKLGKATSPADFHLLSTVIKLVMLTGILSMVFFRYYL